MTRLQMEHVIRAAAMIADDDELVVIGSQAILGEHPDAPAELLVSRELDLYPKNHPERADLIDGAIGEGSPFDREFGYFAHGIGPETAVLPEGWDTRLVVVSNANTRGAKGYCLEKHDLALAKLAAGREKDLEYYRALVEKGLVDRHILRQRLGLLPVSDDRKELIERRIG